MVQDARCLLPCLLVCCIKNLCFSTITKPKGYNRSCIYETQREILLHLQTGSSPEMRQERGWPARALCAEEDGEGQVDLLGSGLQDPAPAISSLTVCCCPVHPVTLQTWRTVLFGCPKQQEGDHSWPCDATLDLTLMSVWCVWVFTVPPLTSLCHSPWACGLLIVSVSFSLKRQQWP